jgi:prepilin-type N-terminal cleavage/methylation domain-containing protein
VALRLLNQGATPVVKSPRSNGFSLLEILVVVGLIAVISAIALPMFGNALADFRLSGDARSVSNAVALSKLRAASDFSRVRLYVDLTNRTHHVESWNKTTSSWTIEGGTTSLAPGVSFSYGIVSTPPPNTQGTIGQAPLCTDDTNMPIADTACIMFNSRGVPIGNGPSFASTGSDAIYITDGSAVFGVTVAATGMLRMWRTLPRATPTWVLS